MNKDQNQQIQANMKVMDQRFNCLELAIRANASSLRNMSGKKTENRK
jgi:hypothetical protein